MLGVEALIRWVHPEAGLISPLDFIPAAEELGLILEIGEWVLRTACKQNKYWQSIGLPPMVMAVNLSPCQLYQSALVETIQGILEETGLAPEYLELEITESKMIDVQRILPVVKELKRIGVWLSLDDFGTGYSSFHHLREFPIDRIKIDSSFVHACTYSEKDAAIVKTIIAMAQQLKLDVVAEGVESKEQLIFLQQHLCNIVQGYLFSKPVPAEEFIQIFHKLELNIKPEEMNQGLSRQNWLEKEQDISIKELLDKVVQYSPTGIAIHRNGKILYANPSALEIIQEKDIVGKSINRFLHPESYKFVKQEKFKVKVKKTPLKRKMKLVRDNGEIINVEIKNISIHYEGSPAILTLFNDETERKKAKRQFEKSIKNLKDVNFALNESSILAITDQKGVIQFVNEKFCRISKYSQEELIGQDHRILNSGNHSKSFFVDMWRTIGNGKTWKGEIRNKAKDGSFYWVDTTIVPFLNDKGKPYQYVSIRNDITERKKAEKALQQSEARYRLIADNMTDLVSLFDRDGFIKYASPSHLTILGFPNEVYEGKRMKDFIHDEDNQRVHNDLYNMVITKKSGVFEYRFRDTNNNWVWLEAKATPIWDEEGHFHHFLVVSREITERRLYEDKITHMAYHDTLTDLPNRRLFIEKIEQSLKIAERYKWKMVVMYLDMDSFKQINDTFGHDVGDELLQQFAGRVKGCLRESDTLARQGGDEFTIFLPDIREEHDAIDIAKRIINSLQEPWQINEHNFKTTCSIGMAFYPKDGKTVDELMKSSDIALYEAKEAGGNNYMRFILQ